VKPDFRPTPLAVLTAGAGALAAALPAIVSPHLWPLWPAALAFLAGLLAADALLSPPPRSITCRLEAPDSFFIGETGEAVLAVELPSPRWLPLEVVVDVSEPLVAPPPFRGRSARAESVVRIPLQARRRGIGALERVWIRYTGPLRLARKTLVRSFDRKVRVVPDVRPVREAALRFSENRTFRAGLKIERYRGDGTEFESLREFVRGDDLRALHWRATARHRKPLCRQFRAERNHQIVFALDTGRLMSEPIAGAVPKLDHAVTTALLLSYVALKSGDRVGLFTFDARVGRYLEPEGGMKHHRTLTHFAAGVEYSDSETNYTFGLTTLLQSLNRRSLVVVLTDFVDTVTAELMVQNLDRLARRHVVMFVSFRDPDLERIAEAPPASALALHRAVVADAMLTARDAVLRRLQTYGVFPLDARPRDVGTHAINRYLEIKRRELV